MEVQQMKDLLKACVLCASLILMFSIGNAAAYEFGSKVISGDADEGKILESFQAAGLTPTIAFLSFGSNANSFDGNSAVYINFAGNLRVNAGDLRLTNYSNLYAAGTKVKSGDLDFGTGPLTPFANPAGQFYYGPRFLAPSYVLDDSVYLKTSPLPLQAGLNDIRLTSPVGAFAAGSKITDSDGDWNTPLTLMTSAAAGVVNLGLGPVAELRFYNKDGDVNALGAPIYGSEDPVYLDVSFPGFASYGIVSPNDVRLSA
jgi:hypothetical protein